MMGGSAQQFSLRWHSFANHLAFSFDALRCEEDLVDVTLCCEGKKIRAHKIILSVCSSYFRETFSENPCKHPVIIFKNVKYTDLQSLIEFMYKGEVSISQDSLSSFLHVAEMLQVRGLSESQELLPAMNEKTITVPIQQPIIEQQQQQQLFITVPEGNKILLTAPQNITTTHQTHQTTELKQASPLKQQQQQTIQVQQKKIEYITTTNDASSGPAAKRKRFLKENRTTRSSTNSTTTFTADNVEGFTKSTTAMLMDENGKESVYDVEYLTMKHEMPEYIVPEMDNSDQNQQLQDQDQDQDMEATFIQETYEIIEDPSKADDGQLGDDNDMGESITQNEDPDDPNKSGADSKWTQCQYCKLVITSVNLWRHVRTQHTSQPPRKCDYCKKTFKNKYSLREHVRISHENKQPALKPAGTTDDAEDEQATTATVTESSPGQQITKVVYLEKIIS